MPSHQLKSVCRSIEQMNLPLLDLLLEEEVEFGGFRRSAFLGEIDRIFDIFRNQGNADLKSEFIRTEINRKNGLPAQLFRFSGLKGNNFFKLKFTMKAEHIVEVGAGCIDDEDDLEAVGAMDPPDIIDLLLYADDMKDFFQSADYRILFNGSRLAKNELLCNPPRTYSELELRDWVKKHQSLYNSIIEEYEFSFGMRWCDFLNLHSELKVVLDFLHEQAQRISSAYTEMNSLKTEDQILQWLLSYEDFNDTLPAVLITGRFCSEESAEFKPEFYIKAEIFTQAKAICRFQNIQHWNLLKKYSIYTREESSEFFKSQDFPDANFLLSLRFHIRQREEARRLGIEYGLNPDDSEKDVS
jgi:hypothetical protein